MLLPPPLQPIACQAMGSGWYTHKVKLFCFLLLILLLEIQGCRSLNSEGLALLKFQREMDSDPFGALANWNFNDSDPCIWSGIHCVDGKVQMLDLNGLSLEGVLAPELGKLTHLRYLVLSKNIFSGTIPKELGQLSMLEVLDLRNNNLSGTIPAEIGGLQSLKQLLLCNNNFEGGIPSELANLNLLSEVEIDEDLASAIANKNVCINRKFAHWFKSGKNLLDSNVDYYNDNPPSLSEPHVVLNVHSSGNIVRRRLIEQASNLAALPTSNASIHGHIIALPSSRSSGSFPAVLIRKKEPPPHPPEPQQDKPPTPSTSSSDKNYSASTTKHTAGTSWKCIVGVSISCFVLIAAAAAMLFVCQTKGVRTIAPWKTGLSGQLQKAFVTGVPKLNRTELETACEDFSNIVYSLDGCTIYKGTLSNGVEIAVASTVITSLKGWSKRAERAYRKKIDTLSRVNHKNFLNLIGYCEEDEPFVRMMVFEYAPNGSLFEHLHVKEVEHLDWSARMRILMGIAYCIQHIHELNPPVAHTELNSNAIFLTDDYAAKIGEISFWKEYFPKSKMSRENESEHSVLPPLSEPETDIYNFGVLLLEIIFGKVPHSKEQNIENWADECLNGERNINRMIDPTLKSFNNKELDVTVEVIRECIQQDARNRPTMNQIVGKLKAVIDISPDQATPRLSPLWWAELEILSAEAA